MGQAFVTQLDTDGDGSVSSDEMAVIAGLESVFLMFDLEADGQVSAEDAARRFELWASNPESSRPFSCQVMLGSSPLEGATVTLVPFEFMGEGLPRPLV